LQKSGSSFSYGDERLDQGRNNVKGDLRENPGVGMEIERGRPRRLRACVKVTTKACVVPCAEESRPHAPSPPPSFEPLAATRT
jgi:hypothetical protein